MRFVASALRVVASLIVIFLGAYALLELGGHLFGDRIYLKNDFQCNIVVIDEHGSTPINIGQIALIKSGFIEQTPTLLIASDSRPILHGLHFSIKQIKAHNISPISVPPFWRTRTFLGSKLVYTLNSNGDLILHPPINGDENTNQPSGLPLEGRKIASCKNSARD